MNVITERTAAYSSLLARRAACLSQSMPAPQIAGSIPFDSGHAFPGVLPDLAREATEALSSFRSETLQYALRSGLPELREWIAGYMKHDGVANPQSDDVLVVNGAKHGLELTCRLLVDEGDSIVVTAPTYFTSIPIFKSFGINFIEIAQDSEGLNVDELTAVLDRREREGRARPKFIYDVPDFHNPSGVTMSARRRKELIELAQRNRILIVEDSPYRKVRFEGESLPSLKALDRDDCVLMLGTFSKLLAPGLRIGWVAGPRELLARMVQLKSDGGSCPLTQRIILQFCRAGRLPEHIQKVQGVYRAHRDRMAAGIRRELPEISFTTPQGGYYLWLQLPARIDGDELARRAAKEGVIVLAGSRFFAGNGGRPSGEQAPRNFVRVAYSHAQLDEIDEGVCRLARAFRSMG
jgi:2-aminoadipate transaminase